MNTFFVNWYISCLHRPSDSDRHRWNPCEKDWHNVQWQSDLDTDK